MKHKISLIIHGPYDRAWLHEINSSVAGFDGSFENIILVCCALDYLDYNEKINSFSSLSKAKIVVIKDTLNPGFFNLNRQLRALNAGLMHVADGSLVIKLRSDQSVNFNKLYHYLCKADPYKLVTTNCFTRIDRMYHPSDMLLCGTKDLLADYFSCPLMSDTHLTHIMKAQLAQSHSSDQQTFLKIVPESYLFRCFLKKKGWSIRESYEDSLNSLRAYIAILNSWDIELRWNGNRTPIMPKGSIILPLYFRMKPFEGGPIEVADYLHRHKLDNTKPSMADIYYISLSRIISWLKFSNRIYTTLLFFIYWITYLLLKLISHCLYLMPHYLHSLLSEKIIREARRMKVKYKKCKNL
jgi:hypothetical protein